MYVVQNDIIHKNVKSPLKGHLSMACISNTTRNDRIYFLDSLVLSLKVIIRNCLKKKFNFFYFKNFCSGDRK